MPGQGFRLDAAIADVYGDLRLAPVLRRLLRHSGRLTGSAAGSISLVDAARGHYVKAAEIGAHCRLGQRFPLDEGATGKAFDRRRPVVIPDYGRLRAGHLAGTDPARRGAAVAVPIWWRGDVIAVNVVFAPTTDDFPAGAVDDLEALTQTAAAAIVLSGRHDPSLGALIARQIPATVTEAGAVRPVSPAVARLATELVTAAARAAVDGAQQRVAVVYRDDGLRLLVQQEGGLRPDETFRRDGVTVEEVPGWGVLVRAELPYAMEPPPFSPREAEVLALLREGLTDREIAARLVVSPKTIEKHVAAVLRKTGTTRRTAAVVVALDNGWIPPYR
ncbi:LuxR C-terminal-related transcriptional regulator [Paractinoplanes maris]|uniref:LuxR C-terminal-related transcriptional regulator n=1 Tax=Paractinoplanes maris TaxID=1734446 RepID=UPI0020226DB1|nr:LuxR C-terminal-related transcriptional regulator [Actinoplanes maris]